MFASSQMLPLFAVPVWAQVLEDGVADPLNEHLLGQLDALKPDEAAGRRRSDQFPRHAH